MKYWRGFILIIVLIVGSCKEDSFSILPGEPYVINTTKGVGYGVFNEASKNRYEGVLYVDEGGVFADKYDVTLKGRGGKIILVTRNKNELPVLNYKKYDAQRFESFPETWDYRDSVYSFIEIQNMPYARVSGYWASYPDTGAPYLSIYLDKRLELIKRDLELTMDIYLPKDSRKASRPLLVFIHGGAFFNGDKASLGFPEWARYFAGCGYTVASVNYRLGFHLNTVSVQRAGFRAVQDVTAAINRIINDPDKYLADPDRVFLAGTSAGGITALNTAFMRDENIPPAARNEGSISSLVSGVTKPFTVRAVGNMWGAVEDTTILHNASTAILSIHSTGDPIVPFGQDHPFNFWGNDVFFPEMFGSGVISSIVGPNRSKLIPLDIPGKHTIHIDEDEEGREVLNPYFEVIKIAMRDFFSEHMLPHPVQIEKRTYSNTYYVDSQDVKSIYWSVTGGAILNQDFNKVDVLLSLMLTLIH